MIAGVIVAVAIMLISAGAISTFVNHHPTIKMLALSFLLLIGLTLLLDGFDQHIPKGYSYFAMAFSLFVEVLNLRVRAHQAGRAGAAPSAVWGGVLQRPCACGFGGSAGARARVGASLVIRWTLLGRSLIRSALAGSGSIPPITSDQTASR
jgi:hypothetical protein